MTEYAFFARKAERWGKDMMSQWGSLNICPCLNYLELLCHSCGELLSISSLKIWGDIQEPSNDIAYLLVCTGDAFEAQNYRVSLVWISPYQVWVSTMEEVIGTLSAYISSRPDWPCALVQLYEGFSHIPLPKDKHLGILSQWKAEESPYGWISQLEVYQLLSTGPPVIYPVGLNGNNELVMTTLSELLHSSASITTNKHLYMRINIPPPPLEEPKCTTLLVDEVHTIPAANSPKTPRKPRVSIAAEVNDLLTWVMVNESSHKSEHSPIGKAATVEAVTSPPHKSEVSPLLVDTSSQASMEEAEASLEGLPANISPIATACSSSSASPSVDPTELWTNANMAADHMLHMKRSTDLKRQSVIWELGLLLHQSEVKEAASVKKAKVVHSWEVLDAKVGCTRSVLEAKCNYMAAVQEAKTIWGNLLQKSEIAYSKAIGEAVALRSSQSVALHGEHIRLMQELEEQALREESKSHHDSLSACQATLHHTLQPLRENLATSYHVLLGQSPLSPPSVLPARGPLVEEQPPMAAPPTPVPKWSPWPKRWLPSPELQGSTSIDKTTPKAMQEGPSSLKRQEAPAWFTSLKPSHAEAFLQDYSIVKEARLCFFSNHSYNFVHDGTHDLSDVFKELAKSTGLLGEAIHKKQLSWTGPEELKQANYTLQSLPKGLRFLRVVPALESPKAMGLMGIHDPDALWCYAGYTYCPWCGKEGQNEGTVVNHLRTTHYRLGLVCDQCFGCPSVTSDSLHQHGHQDCQQYSVPSGLGPSDWPTFLTEGLYKGVKVVLFNQTLWKARRLNEEGATHQPILPIFYSPTLPT